MSIQIKLEFEGTPRQLLDSLIQEALQRGDACDGKHREQKAHAAALRTFAAWMQRIEIKGEIKT